MICGWFSGQWRVGERGERERERSREWRETERAGRGADVEGDRQK